MTTKSQTDNTELGEILTEVENTCDYCDGKGYTETGGMSMEDDLVEQTPCDEPIHKAVETAKQTIQAKLKEQDIKSRIDVLNKVLDADGSLYKNVLAELEALSSEREPKSSPNTTTSELGEILAGHCFYSSHPKNRLCVSCDEAIKAIEQKYIRRDLVIEAIGENKYSDMQIIEMAKTDLSSADFWKGQASLRAEIRQTLNLLKPKEK